LTDLKQMQCANKLQQKSTVPITDFGFYMRKGRWKHGEAKGKSSGLRCQRARYLIFSSLTAMLKINNSV